jgi:hypothetical protein
MFGTVIRPPYVLDTKEKATTFDAVLIYSPEIPIIG